MKILPKSVFVFLLFSSLFLLSTISHPQAQDDGIVICGEQGAENCGGGGGSGGGPQPPYLGEYVPPPDSGGSGGGSGDGSGGSYVPPPVVINWGGCNAVRSSITAQAVAVPANSTCQTIQSSTQPVSPTTFTLYPLVSSYVYNGAAVGWGGLCPGTYRVVGTPPAGNYNVNTCWTKTHYVYGQFGVLLSATTTQGEGEYITVTSNQSTYEDQYDAVSVSTGYTQSAPSCTISLSPSPMAIQIGSSNTLAATVSCVGGNPTSLVFTSNDATIATTTSPDSSLPYTSDISGLKAGTTTIVVQAMFGSSVISSANVTVNVATPTAWWQVNGGDVTSYGNINSQIPDGCTGSCLPYLIRNGSGGFPGLALYGGPPSNYDFSANTTSNGIASDQNWLSGWDTMPAKRYDWAYVQSLLPSSMTFNPSTGNLNSGLVGTGGYIWHRYNGNLTISSPQSITNKVVLFVQGNLTIQRSINIPNPGTGFFLAVVSGDIIIDGTLADVGTTPAIEGLYLADGQIRTGTGDSVLTIRGAAASWNGFSLQRDLGANNASSPAERFDFQPSLLLLYPQLLTKKPVIWREIAP